MSNTRHTARPNRAEYRDANGSASWWSKDGAWHIALPEPGRDGFFWTATQYATRADAVAAIAKAEVQS